MVLGIVATRTSVSEGFTALGAPVYYVFPAQAREDITSFRATWSHWWGNAQSPGAGNNLTIDWMEIEYPAGVFTDVLFGGSASATTGPLTNISNDPTPIDIPDGAWFKLHGMYHGCCLQTRGPNAAIGEGSVFPATGLNKVTARSAAFNANATFTPSVIFGDTGKPSALVLGDSLDSGLGDSYQRADGSYGAGFGALINYGCAQMVQWGGSPADYLAAAGPLQAELVQYASDIVATFSANRLFFGNTAAATLADHAAIKALYPGKRYHLTTCTPCTTSGNNWIDLAGQTVIANEAELQAYNVAVLANAMGYAPPLDFAAVLEHVRGGGKWKFDGTANKWTIDGTHCSPFGYAQFAGAGFALAPLGNVRQFQMQARSSADNRLRCWQNASPDRAGAGYASAGYPGSPLDIVVFSKPNARS